MTNAKAITAQEQALETLGEYIRNERDACGISQLAVASYAGVSQPLYSGIESGHRPLTAHRVGQFGDCVTLGVIKYLLTQLRETRYELVRASDERMCAASMATLASLVAKSSQVCAVMAAALEDGDVSDSELDGMENGLANLEETVRKVRRDVAVRRELSKRNRREIASLVKTKTGSGVQAKAASK